jgi:hypothetical protein
VNNNFNWIHAKPIIQRIQTHTKEIQKRLLKVDENKHLSQRSKVLIKGSLLSQIQNDKARIRIIHWRLEKS